MIRRLVLRAVLSSICPFSGFWSFAQKPNYGAARGRRHLGFCSHIWNTSLFPHPRGISSLYLGVRMQDRSHTSALDIASQRPAIQMSPQRQSWIVFSGFSFVFTPLFLILRNSRILIARGPLIPLEGPPASTRTGHRTLSLRRHTCRYGSYGVGFQIYAV